MNYEVIYTKKAVKSLRKIDKEQQRLIVSWIEKHLVNTIDPKATGKPLKGNLNEFWRYRVGNYRILAEIDNDQVKIIVVNVGHRRDVYS